MPPRPLKVMILAGGRGERFWPLSTAELPKPFLSLGGPRTLLQETYVRARMVARPENIRVVAGSSLSRLIRRQLRPHGGGRLLVEPAARNTGPASLLAARIVSKECPGAEILTLPSDHQILNTVEFRRAVSQARSLARRGYLVTFGVAPSGPDPSYGYIVPGKKIEKTAREVTKFVEKPRPARARTLLDRDSALWNSGIFLWQAEVFLEEATRHEPAFAGWLKRTGGRATLSADAKRAFCRLPSLPVDRAVLERSGRVAVVPVRFLWSDLGTWDSLYQVLPGDSRGNAKLGQLVALNSKDNLVVNRDGLTLLVGMKNFLVVRSGDLLFVAPRNQSQQMRSLLEQLRSAGHGRFL